MHFSGDVTENFYKTLVLTLDRKCKYVKKLEKGESFQNWVSANFDHGTRRFMFLEHPVTYMCRLVWHLLSILDQHNVCRIIPYYYCQTFISDASPSLSKTKVLSSEGSTSGAPSPVTQGKGKEHVSKSNCPISFLTWLKDLLTVDAMLIKIFVVNLTQYCLHDCD
jgi:hypothetical protein